MKTVLVVDDEVELGEIVAEQLGLVGFKARVATGGKQALDVMSTESFDAVLCDVKMPNGDGPSLLINARERGIMTPFIFMTADTDLETQELLDLGAFEVFLKPVGIDQIESRLHALWAEN